MSLLDAIIMGIIQGLTEFLPVSSSGHLCLFKQFFDIETDGMLFDILLHIGTLIAVFAVYYKDIWKMIKEGFGIIGDAFVNVATFLGNKIHKESNSYRKLVNNSYRKFVMLVIVSTIPTGIIGVVASDLVSAAEQILIVPGICLIITSILLFVADHLKDGKKTPKTTTYTNAFAVGICQGVATLPGLSRSGTTITACLLTGMNRKFAVKYSFIMSIPAILGALVFEIKDVEFAALQSAEILNYVVGTLVAMVVGYICIKTMLVVVRKKKFTIFSIYCLILGLFSVGAYFYLA
ncbi:MAG: undecaprenyl-diphosphate phosphatase [Lachnospiraceae bacterium]|nr:undecaprenyl-diphosphate phosphatase [Lachnospiraceae bacterium]